MELIDIIGILFTFIFFAVLSNILGSSMLKRSRETSCKGSDNYADTRGGCINFKPKERIHKTRKETIRGEKRGMRIAAGLNLRYLFIRPVGSMIVRFTK